MGCRRTCCYIVLVPVILVLGLVSLSLFPAAESAVVRAGGFLPDRLFYVFSITQVLRIGVKLLSTTGISAAKLKNEIARDMYSAGDETGTGYHRIMVNFGTRDGIQACPFRHKTVTEIEHSLDTKVPKDNFLGSLYDKLPPGVIPEGVVPSILNLDSNDPRLFKRKNLLVETFNLKRDREWEPFTSPFKEIPEFSSENTFHVVGFNLYKRIFGVELSQELLEDHYEYINLLLPAVPGKFKSDNVEGGKRVAELRANVEAALIDCDKSREFLAEAEALGMDATARFREAVFITMFAGYHGTSSVVEDAVTFIKTQPAKYVPLFRDDPTAFMLEIARMFPPVAGIQFIHDEAIDQVLGNGVIRRVEAGEMGMCLSNGANYDPEVFEDPWTFKPGRANADRFVTWNSEFRAIRQCPTPAGCDTAPRACPGTEVALQLAMDAVTFWVSEVVEKELAGTKTEL